MRFPLVLISTALCGFLTACGGGGSGSNSTPAAGGQPPANGGSNSITGVVFKALPPSNTSTATFLQLLNGQGADGYRYIGDQGFSDGDFSIFVKDGLAPSYSYELQPSVANANDLLTQADAQGSQGFRYVGPYAVGGTNMTLYRKDADTTASYTYLALPTASTPDAFVQEANTQGNLGFWYVGPLFVGNGQDLFMADAASTTTYTYKYEPSVTSKDALLTALNDEGKQGYRYKGGAYIGGVPVNLFVKDNSQNPTFVWQAAPLLTTSQGFIDQANGFGMSYFAPLNLNPTGDDADAFDLYFSGQACTGFICATLSPLTQS